MFTSSTVQRAKRGIEVLSRIMCVGLHHPTYSPLSSPLGSRSLGCVLAGTVLCIAGLYWVTMGLGVRERVELHQTIRHLYRGQEVRAVCRKQKRDTSTHCNKQRSRLEDTTCAIITPCAVQGDAPYCSLLSTTSRW